MSTGLNQYAVYRLRRDIKETRSLRNQSYQYLLKNNRKVASDHYRQLFLARFDPSLTPADLRRQLEKELPAGITGKALEVSDVLALTRNGITTAYYVPAGITGKALEVSDVLALTRNGITTAYYVDSQRLVSLPGFFHVYVSAPVLSLGTTDYKIEGRPGTWTAREEYWVDGRRFLLMQSQQFGSKAALAVLDSDGHPAAEDTFTGFEYIHHSDNSRDDAAGKTETRGEDRSNADVVTVPVSADSSESNNGPSRKIDERESRAGDKQIVKTKKKPAKRKRKAKKKRKGPRPLWSRSSVLERLRKYQMKLAEKQSAENASEATH